jgi:hypothetical protein
MRDVTSLHPDRNVDKTHRLKLISKFVLLYSTAVVIVLSLV